MKPLALTSQALKHVKKQLKDRGSGAGFRIGIEQVGCNGLKHTFECVDNAETDDFVFPIDEDKTLFICVKKEHYPYLAGTIVDYGRNPTNPKSINRELLFNNPNATGACGCGESFNVM